jgi:VanZ family protein
MRLRYHKFWLLLGWGMIVLVLYLSLTPQPPELGFELWDKLKHFIAYAVLMGWFGQLYRQHRRLLYALGFIGMGIALEYLQGMGEYRMFEYHDMLANLLGVSIAMLVLYLKGDQVLHWFEKKVLKAG